MRMFIHKNNSHTYSQEDLNVDFFSILTLLGGVGLFLFGMNMMGDSLKNLAGGSLEKILEKLTTGKSKATGAIKGFGLGTAVTAIIQSSAATTIMLIGFVNAGIMKLGQAIPVVFGANVGSTATAQILRLGDLGEDMFILKLLKPSSFAPVLIGIGAFIILFAKKKSHKDIAGIMVGLGILFLGMNTMESVFAPLKESATFQNLFTSFSNPLLGILIGLVLTAVIQSSSASVGILQALSSTGVVTYGSAIPIIIGMNIGKCSAILLGGLGTNKKAKRVALSYVLFNVVGALFFVVVIYGFQLFVDFPFMSTVINRGIIANLHFGFNFIIAVLMLPFSNKLAALTGKILGDDEESRIDKELATLDPMLLDTPNIALTQAQKVMFSMTDSIQENFEIGSQLINQYDTDLAAKLLENEMFIDKCESALNEYLLKITSKRLHSSERKLASELLNSVSDLERIGDHCENLLNVANKISDDKISFSKQGTMEIQTLLDATGNIIQTTFGAFKNDDLTAVSRIEPLAQAITEVKEIIKDHHVIRLQTGDCGISGGFALVDILTSLDRIGSHCANIGLHIAKKLSTDTFDEMHGHIYTNGYKTSEEYKALYCYYMSLYSDPITEKYQASLQEIQKKISGSADTNNTATESAEAKLHKNEKNDALKKEIKPVKKGTKIKGTSKAKLEKAKIEKSKLNKTKTKKDTKKK